MRIFKKRYNISYLEVRRSHFKSGHVSKGQYVGAGLVGPGLVSGTSEVVAGAELRVDITPPSSCQVRSVAVTLQCHFIKIANSQLCGGRRHSHSWAGTEIIYYGWDYYIADTSVYNRSFPCIEATYPYAIKNQRKARNAP